MRFTVQELELLLEDIGQRRELIERKIKLLRDDIEYFKDKRDLADYTTHDAFAFDVYTSKAKEVEKEIIWQQDLYISENNKMAEIQEKIKVLSK